MIVPTLVALGAASSVLLLGAAAGATGTAPALADAERASVRPRRRPVPSIRVRALVAGSAGALVGTTMAGPPGLVGG
ncbi:MAG: hypothetical protein ACRDHU_12965, partial [Actinomycetota bacterium]